VLQSLHLQLFVQELEGGSVLALALTLLQALKEFLLSEEIHLKI
jgi:hypothetical protein